jgi:hypothetical protein
MRHSLARRAPVARSAWAWHWRRARPILEETWSGRGQALEEHRVGASLFRRHGPALALLLAASWATRVDATSGEEIARLVRQLDAADPRAQHEALEELALIDRSDRDIVLRLVTSKSRRPVSEAQALLLTARMPNLDQPSDQPSSFPPRREDVRFSDEAISRIVIAHAIGELGVGNAEATELALLDLHDERPRVRLSAAFLCRCGIESPAACLVDLHALHGTVDPRVGGGRILPAGCTLDRQALGPAPAALPNRKVTQVRRAVDQWLDGEHDPSLEDIVGLLRMAPPDPAVALIRSGGPDGMRWGVAALRAEGRADDVALQAVLSQPGVPVAEVSAWLDGAPTERLVARLADASDGAASTLVDAIARRGAAALPALLQALGLDDAKARSRATWAISRIDPRPADLARALVPIYARAPRGDDLESLLIELGASAASPLADAMRSLATDEQRIALVQRLEYFEGAGSDALRIALHSTSPEVALAALETLGSEDARPAAFMPDVLDFLRVPATIEAVEKRWFHVPRCLGDVATPRCPPPLLPDRLHEAACDVVSATGSVPALLGFLREDVSPARRAAVLVAIHECVRLEDATPSDRAALGDAAMAATEDPAPDARMAAFAARSRPRPRTSPGGADDGPARRGRARPSLRGRGLAGDRRRRRRRHRRSHVDPDGGVERSGSLGESRHHPRARRRLRRADADRRPRFGRRAARQRAMGARRPRAVRVRGTARFRSRCPRRA